jgi:hypothetical protein
MKCPECDFDCPDNAVECPACGLIFDRWKEHSEAKSAAAPSHVEEDETPDAEPVSESTPEPEPTPTPTAAPSPVVPPKKKKTLLYVGLGLLVVLIAFALFQLVSSKSGSGISDISIVVPSTKAPGSNSSTPVVSGTPAVTPLTTPVIAQAPTATSIPEAAVKPVEKAKAEVPVEKKPPAEAAPKAKAEPPAEKKHVEEAAPKPKPKPAEPKPTPTPVPAAPTADDNSAVID